MKYFSTKKSRVVTLAVLVFIAVVFVLIRHKKNNPDSLIFERSKIDTDKKEFELLASRDSDNDGLRDWEETLWKTDPKNPDSDGDGTSDGEEVRSERDPTKQAPNDTLESIDYKNTPVTSGEKYISPTTATGVLIEEYLKQYVEIKNTGDGEITEKSMQPFLDSILQKIDLKLSYASISHKNTELKVIKTTEENEASELKKYGNKLAQIYIDALANPAESELEIIKEVFSSKENISLTDIEEGKESLKRLDLVVLDYNNIISKLLEVETPDTIVNIHLKMINEYERIKVSIESISVFFTDTLRGVAGISAYFKRLGEFYKITDELKNVFTTKEIIFNNDELGYLFFATALEE